jgi:hypothetical protein
MRHRRIRPSLLFAGGWQSPSRVTRPKSWPTSMMLSKGEGWTLDRLPEEGFPEILAAVNAMLRRDHEA